MFSSLDCPTSVHMKRFLPLFTQSALFPSGLYPMSLLPFIAELPTSVTCFPFVVSHSSAPLFSSYSTQASVPTIPHIALIKSTMTLMMLTQGQFLDLTLLDLSTVFNMIIWQPLRPLSRIPSFSWIPRELLLYPWVLLLRLLSLQVVASSGVQSTELVLPLPLLTPALSHQRSCYLYAPGLSTSIAQAFSLNCRLLHQLLTHCHHLADHGLHNINVSKRETPAPPLGPSPPIFFPISGHEVLALQLVRSKGMASSFILLFLSSLSIQSMSPVALPWDICKIGSFWSKPPSLHVWITSQAS